MPNKRWVRAAVTGALIAAALGAYHFALAHYLTAVQRPFSLKLGFWGSLIWACTVELKNAPPREWPARMLTTTSYFATAALFASEIRSVYLSKLSEVLGYPEAKSEMLQWLGSDAMGALTNPLLGLGACFGVALLALRLTLPRIVEKLRGWGQTPRAESLPCPCCGQPLPDSRKL